MYVLLSCVVKAEVIKKLLQLYFVVFVISRTDLVKTIYFLHVTYNPEYVLCCVILLSNGFIYVASVACYLEKKFRSTSVNIIWSLKISGYLTYGPDLFLFCGSLKLEMHI
jgi:hypothetical protein